VFPKKTVLGEVEVNRVRVVAEENDNEKAEIGDVAFSIFLFSFSVVSFQQGILRVRAEP
jgi:hypothetical protein